jgi:hypothetical protein
MRPPRPTRMSLSLGSPDQHRDGCTHGRGQPIPGVDDGGQIGIGPPRTSDIRPKLGGDRGGIRRSRGVSIGLCLSCYRDRMFPGG